MKRTNWAGFDIIERDLTAARIDGECDFTAGEIRIEKALRYRRELDTILHEGLHALDPDASESKVTNTARLLADLLWKMNYRRK